MAERKSPESPERSDQAAEPPRATESTYTRAESLASAARFGVSPAVVAGAWRLAGKGASDRLTRTQLEAAIREFAEREVTI
ncbi:MAG: oligoribonuclease [Chloroflexota bacterium]